MQANVTEVVVYQLSIKWYKEWRTSPEYKSLDEAMDAMKKFVEKFDGKFLTCTVVKSKRFVAAE